MASLVASGLLVRRVVTPRLAGWRATLARELVAGTLATAVTAPLVAFAFARVSLAGPFSNLAAAPVVAVLQPALFLAMLLEPVPPLAALVADATRPLLAALDAIAGAFASLPGVAPVVAPTALTAALLGAAAIALVVACSADAPARSLVAVALLIAASAWGSVVRPVPRAVELHMLDVGQGDALALRTPAGRWVVFDAGRAWRGGDAARTTIIPFLRRRGGAIAALVLSHPHTDHVGGAASLLRELRPGVLYDAAFAGDAQAYREALLVADSLAVPWRRVRPGDSLVVDGAIVRFLAPDSAWTASLDDPNLASTIARVDFGVVRFLLTGDAEAPEEAWLLARDAAALRADVLKVAHHGSRTSSGDEFLDAVRPRVALVSVGLGNTYRHPSGEVMAGLARRGAQVLRSDELGSVIVHSDGRALEIEAYGVRWTVSGDSSD
jgi:competence protein ComEC